MDDFSRGLLLGLLITVGHFGGDGRQPQITVRMHARHRALFSWLLAAVPDSRLYGPYYHGGRHYYQWMVRGTALRRLVALLDELPLQVLDPPTFERYTIMKENYGLLRPRG